MSILGTRIVQANQYNTYQTVNTYLENHYNNLVSALKSLGSNSDNVVYPYSENTTASVVGSDLMIKDIVFLKDDKIYSFQETTIPSATIDAALSDEERVSVYLEPVEDFNADVESVLIQGPDGVPSPTELSQAIRYYANYGFGQSVDINTDVPDVPTNTIKIAEIYKTAGQLEVGLWTNLDTTVFFKKLVVEVNNNEILKISHNSRIGCFEWSVDGGNGYLEMNGGTYLIADYPLLHGKLDGVLEGYSSDGTNFTLPNWDNYFLRYDSSRTVGNTQSDALQNITGQVDTPGGVNDGQFLNPSGVFFGELGNTKGSQGGSGTLQSDIYDRLRLDASRVARTSDETRPKNVSLKIYVVADYQV